MKIKSWASGWKEGEQLCKDIVWVGKKENGRHVFFSSPKVYETVVLYPQFGEWIVSMCQ